MGSMSKIVKERSVAKYPGRNHHRCSICGRSRAYLRKFGLCRICFRGLAHKGELPGVMKVSL